jgi:hypothetical protein
LVLTSKTFENIYVSTFGRCILFLFDNSSVVLATCLISLLVESHVGHLLASLEECNKLFSRHVLTELVRSSALLDGADERLGVEAAQVDSHEQLFFKFVLVFSVTRLDQILRGIFFADGSLRMTFSTTH